MHPATLAAGLRPNFLNRLPEAERAVGDRQLGTHRQPAPLQVEQQFPPGLRTLAHAVDQAALVEMRHGEHGDAKTVGQVGQRLQKPKLRRRWPKGPGSLTSAGSVRRGTILAPIGDFLTIVKLEDHDIRTTILGMSREVTI